jgi:hypothetical protein
MPDSRHRSVDAAPLTRAVVRLAWGGVLVALASHLACAPSPSQDPGARGGSGGAPGAGGAPGLSSSGAAGAAAKDGATGGGAGTSATDAGVVPGTGGTGGAGAASDGGSGTARDAGSAPDGGAPADDKAAARVLDGYAILKPCVSTFKPTPNANGDCCCEELPANENQHHTEHFGGDPNVTYNVTLRVAGIAERYWYAGGVLDPVSKLFYVGGRPTIHSTAAPNANLAPGSGACKIHPPQTDGSFALPFTVPVEINPSDGCFNGFNIFALVVSSPKQSYYLNDTTDFDGVDRQPHKVYKNDYTVTFPIKGQAQLDFFTLDGDHHQVTNDGTMMVPGVTTAQPYNGNFLELSVVAVTRAP